MITGSNIPDPGKGTRCKEAPRRHHTDTVLREEDLGGEPYALRGARTDRKGVDHTGLPCAPFNYIYAWLGGARTVSKVRKTSYLSSVEKGVASDLVNQVIGRGV